MPGVPKEGPTSTLMSMSTLAELEDAKLISSRVEITFNIIQTPVVCSFAIVISVLLKGVLDIFSKKENGYTNLL